LFGHTRFTRFDTSPANINGGFVSWKNIRGERTNCEQLFNIFQWTAQPERVKVSATLKVPFAMEQEPNCAVAEENLTALTEEEINRLKGRFEEKLARSHSKARWEGMVEDCQIILTHLESNTH
jgi:hypothetical protein